MTEDEQVDVVIVTEPNIDFVIKCKAGIISGRSDDKGRTKHAIPEAVLQEMYAGAPGYRAGDESPVAYEPYACRPKTECRLTFETDDGVTTKKSGVCTKIPENHDDTIFLMHLKTALHAIYRHEYVKRMGSTPVSDLFRAPTTPEWLKPEHPLYGPMVAYTRAEITFGQKMTKWIDSLNKEKDADDS